MVTKTYTIVRLQDGKRVDCKKCDTIRSIAEIRVSLGEMSVGRFQDTVREAIRQCKRGFHA